MGVIWVKEFTGGLDTRRLPETTPPGVMIRARDGHITRGGEFEKRAAFVPTYALPEGTIGLAQTRTGLVVFGHQTAPTMPAGVSYQRLQHPDGTTALAAVPSYDLYDGLIYAVGLFADGSIHHFYNGVRVEDWFDGRARAEFRVTGGVIGAAPPPTSTLTNIVVDGVSIISAPVAWTGTVEGTAAAIAAEINSAVSSPEYSATAVGDRVNIISTVAGSAANGRVVTLTTADGLTLSTLSTVLAGGADSDTSYTPGTFVRTIKSKMYSVAESLFHFSGIQQPTQWTPDVPGAGFINMATQNSGSEQLTAVARYQNLVAIFSPEVVQIWFVDPDPELNVVSQVLSNTGTSCPLSVTQFGDSDLFYLDESGLRSLRARDSSNSAATTDIGVPIDDLLAAKLATLTLDERAQVTGLINPIDKRFWLIIKDEVYVFSFYQNAKVSAWTTYELASTVAGVKTPFEAQQAVVWNRRVYLRSDDLIYAYGGVSAGLVYDQTEAEGWLPYFDATRPTAKKNWEGIDAAVTGLWEIRAATQPTNLDTDEVIANIYQTTYNQHRIAYHHSSSHLSLRMTSKGTGPAVLSALAIHFEGGEDET